MKLFAISTALLIGSTLLADKDQCNNDLNSFMTHFSEINAITGPVNGVTVMYVFNEDCKKLVVSCKDYTTDYSKDVFYSSCKKIFGQVSMYEKTGLLVGESK